MEKENNNPEMEELRRQVEILQKKLQGQDIINTSLLRNSMKADTNYLQQYNLIMAIAGIILAPVIYFLYNEYNTPIAIILAICCVIDAIYHFIVSRQYARLDLNSSVVALSEHLLRARRWSKYNLILGLAVVLPIFVWLSILEPDFIIPVCIGLAIGIPIAYIFYSKEMEKLHALSVKIKELKEE